MLPTVSINITTYANRSRLLQRAIDSVFRQSFKNWELIIVCDGSTDYTRQLINKYCRLDKRVHGYFHKQNLGTAAARNTAMMHSQGHYVAWLDDDDEWTDINKLKKQIAVFKSKKDPKLAIVCTSVNIVSIVGSSPRIVHPPADPITFILSGNGLIYSPTVMTTLKVMHLVGGFDTHFPRGVDSEFFRTCIVKYKLRVFFMQDITTNVYLHSGYRLTPINTFPALKNNLYVNLLILKKYRNAFFTHPVSLIKRVMKIILIILNMIKLALLKVNYE